LFAFVPCYCPALLIFVTCCYYAMLVRALLHYSHTLRLSVVMPCNYYTLSFTPCFLLLSLLHFTTCYSCYSCFCALLLTIFRYLLAHPLPPPPPLLVHCLCCSFSCLAILPCQFVLPFHPLVWVEELGATSTSFIQQVCFSLDF
jgi:hypothetical protein